MYPQFILASNDELSDIFANLELDASTKFTAAALTYQKRQCPGRVGVEANARTGDWPVIMKGTLIMPLKV